MQNYSVILPSINEHNLIRQTATHQLKPHC